VSFGGVSQDHCDEPDCNLASRDSDGAGTFSEEVSHLSVRMNKQIFDGVFLTFLHCAAWYKL
jgi:hypothetical protein